MGGVGHADGDECDFSVFGRLPGRVVRFYFRQLRFGGLAVGVWRRVAAAAVEPPVLSFVGALQVGEGNEATRGGTLAARGFPRFAAPVRPCALAAQFFGAVEVGLVLRRESLTALGAAKQIPRLVPVDRRLLCQAESREQEVNDDESRFHCREM